MFVATYFKTHVSCTKWWSTPSKKERKKHKHWMRNKSYRKHFFRHVMATSTISCLLNSFPSSASSHSNPPIQIERSATTVFLNSLWIQMKCRFFFFGKALKCHISPCPLLSKALFPLESKHSQSVLQAFLCFAFTDKVLHCPGRGSGGFCYFFVCASVSPWQI